MSAAPIPAENIVRIDTSDGHTLDGLLRLPPRAQRVVVCCHSHPLHGGTMHNAIIVAMVNALACASSHVGSLRFNFRSVEGAKGRHFCRNAGPIADAHEEQLDVIGAIDGLLNAFSGIAVSIVGYSFGSMVGLRAAWAHPEVDRIALIAPAVRIFSYAEGHACRRPLPTDILVGDRDRFAPVAEVRSLAKCLGARLHTISGADHFFEGHQQDVAQMLLPCVAPETCTADTFLR